MYLDPGFAGMLLGIVVAIAAFAGGLWFSIRRNARNMLSRNKDNDENNITPIQRRDDESDDAVDMLDDQ